MERLQYDYERAYNLLGAQYDLLKEDYLNVINFLKRNNLIDKYIDEKKKSGIVPQ